MSIKTDYVLAFSHRADLEKLLRYHLNSEFVEELGKCVNIIGFEDQLYKVVRGRLNPPMDLPCLRCNNPMLPYLWHSSLVAAYSLEDGKLARVLPEKGEDRLGAFLSDVVATMQTYTGPFGIRSWSERNKTPT